jgi:hypothetical protein
LGTCTGISRLAGTAAADRVVGGGEDSFQVAGTAVGTCHLNFFLLIHHQDFHVLITVQALKFEYGHLDLLMEKSL